jgi:hypothetical protein
MAGHTPPSGRPLNRETLAAVTALTRSLAEAVLQGDLDRALALLEERRQRLQQVAWPDEVEAELREEVQALRSLEAEVLDFCRRWRNIVQERLAVLHTAHHLLKTYQPPPPPPRLVDLQK